MIKYIHGSGDSTDIDVHYVFDKLPSFQECKAFADKDLSENRNIITIENGIVTGCYKGTIDEINNALLDTYSLHPQEYPLLVTNRVSRNKELKYVRAIRGILSHLSRSKYRPQIKAALKANWSVKLQTLLDLQLCTIDFNSLNKHMSAEDIKKVIAFQIGQSLGLMNNKELYTKESIAIEFPNLRKYLYREPNTEIHTLEAALFLFVKTLKNNIPFTELPNNCVKFDLVNKIFNLTTEHEVEA